MAHGTSSITTEGPCKDYDEQVDVIAELPQQDPDFLNQQLSFPFPERGPPTRPPGFGCLACVHQTYCPALYWFRRYTDEQPDDNHGRDCLAFSNNLADQIPAHTTGTGNDFDRADNARRNCDAILTEPNRNGITSPTTGGRR